MAALLVPTMLTVLSGLLVAVATRPVLSLLTEPGDGDGKIAYRELATPRFVLACALSTMLAQALTLTLLPPSALPTWTVLATAGVLLAAIDARTTWLPIDLTRASWGLMAAAVALTFALGGTTADLVRTALGAAVATAVYWLAYRITRRGFGFGDVRFAPLLGAATAGESWALLSSSLFLGSAVGAVHGVSRLVRRRRGGFPYAPSMLTGCYLAAVALALLLAFGPV